MRYVIVQYHIFKNAGTTVEGMLDRSFGARFDRLERPVQSEVITNAAALQWLDARPELRAFSSHQLRHPVPAAPGYLFFDICFLRDPLDRVRSFYDYFRQKPDPADPVSHLANRRTLGDFVHDLILDFPRYVTNPQTNYLACAGDSDNPDEHDLDLAVRRMLSTSFLGVVDCFHQSAVAGREALRCAFPELDCENEPLNVSRGMCGTLPERTAALRHACGEDVYHELLRINSLDRRLVRRARAEVLRRFNQVSSNAASTRPDLRPVGSTETPASDFAPSTPRGTLTGRKQSSDVGFHTVRPTGGQLCANPGPEPTPRHRTAHWIAAAARLASLAPYWREVISLSRGILFDPACYRASQPDDSRALSFPLLHFLAAQAPAGQPHPLFDAEFYLRKYPDVALAGVNPLCHYLKFGAAELRQPHPLFDPVWFLSHSSVPKFPSADALIFYLHSGAAQFLKPNPLFEPSHYRMNHPLSSVVAGNPLVEFLRSGADADRPHPLFDCDAYLAAHPDVAARGLNPLVHYLVSVSTEDEDHDRLDIPAWAQLEDAPVVELDLDDARLVVFCLDEMPRLDAAGYRNSPKGLESSDKVIMFPGTRPARAPDPQERRTLHAAGKERAQRLGIPGSIALVWQDSHGITHWIAEPQQLPFLRAVAIEQVRAQLAAGQFVPAEPRVHHEHEDFRLAFT